MDGERIGHAGWDAAAVVRGRLDPASQRQSRVPGVVDTSVALATQAQEAEPVPEVELLKAGQGRQVSVSLMVALKVPTGQSRHCSIASAKPCTVVTCSMMAIWVKVSGL